MSKFDELKKLAEAASPGPWKYEVTSDGYSVSNSGFTLFSQEPYDNHPPSDDDAEFIAAANPAAILELLAIQAQLVAALQSINGWIDPDGPVAKKIDAALSAAGAQP